MFTNLEFKTKINKEMIKIRGRDLVKLGFKKEKERTSAAPDENYHYYTYEVNKHCMLISCSNDEKNLDSGYYVEFYEIPEVRFTELKDLEQLVKLLKKATA
jgi:hypothetical protein